MFKEYRHLQDLSPFQNEQVRSFNKNSKIQYEKLSNCEICRSEK